MKTIVSVIMAAALIMGTLSACGTTSRTNADNGRLQTTPAAAATAIPSATAGPDTLGDRVGNAARDAGSAVGDAVEDAGDMAGNAVKDAGDAVSDLVDGDNSGRYDTGLVEDRVTPRP